MAFVHPVGVRYLEVDAQGVVFNAWYLAWFDDAMTAYLAHRGLPYRTMLDAGYDVQVVRSEIDWQTGVGFGDTVGVEVSTARIGQTSFALKASVAELHFASAPDWFDGGRVSYDRPSWNATAFGFVPTQGGFEISANRELDSIWLTGASLTAKRIPKAPPADLGLFWIYYQDGRSDVLKTDNRPLPVRQADHDAIAIHTAGARVLTDQALT